MAPDAARRRSTNGWIPLHLACCCPPGRPDLISELIQAWPLGLQQTTNDGCVPLHWAVINGVDVSVVEMMIRAWPEGVHRENTDGRLPLHHMCYPDTDWSDERRVIAILSRLIEAWPLSVRHRDHQGRIPLHCAVETGAAAGVAGGGHLP